MTEEDENAFFMLECLLSLHVALRDKEKKEGNIEAVDKRNQEIMRLMQKKSQYMEEGHYCGA